MSEESTIIAPEKSTHNIETFILGPLTKHPNADSLSLIKIGDTDYTYVGRTDDWQGREGQSVCWIPPDSLVDTRKAEFAFLSADSKFYKDSSRQVKLDKGPPYFARIKAKKLRGIVSYGLMVPTPTEGAESLNVFHYEAPLNEVGPKGAKYGSGEVASAPSGYYPKYDVDAFLKYGRKLFVEGEPVYISEKIHGANSRYVFQDGAMHCGSRTEWKKEFATLPKLALEDLIQKVGDEAKAREIYERVVVNFKPTKNMWWSVLEVTPSLRAFCEANPGFAVYGEVYGQVQNLKYGTKSGEIRFAAFDVLMPNRQWMDPIGFLHEMEHYQVPTVPVIHRKYCFNFEEVVDMAVGNSLVSGANHIREGVVIKPLVERWDERLGRVMLKVINPAYLEKE